MAGCDIVPGRNFTESEYESGAPVVLVNDKVVERLFNGGEAVCKYLRLNGQLFTVFGVYNPIANIFDSSDKGRLIVPITTAQRRLNISLYWMELTVKPREGADRDAVMDETIATLRAVRHLRPGQTNDFFTYTPEKLLALYNKIVGVFFLVMITLSAVGLLVGGVGVVAIMMISVTGRTREIGVRKALGATRRAILWQFLVEASTLTLVGGAVGMLGGGLLAFVMSKVTPIPAYVPLWSIIAALAASALTGIGFGLYPASRAARLDPVEALRYE